MDRISLLPDLILHQILSHLDTKAAAQTTVLSKTWLSVWLTYPNLDFNFFSFGKYIPHFDPDEILYPDIEQRREKFIKFVENTLSRYSQSPLLVHKFRLVMHMINDSRYPSLIEKCVTFAVEKDVKILHLVYSPSKNRKKWLHIVPEIIFATKSLIELVLSSCNFDNANHVRDRKIEFNYLKKMVLYDLSLDDWVIRKLISSCPSIEEIEFVDCPLHREKLRISNVPKLKKFRMHYSCWQAKWKTVEIDAPSLELFNYRGDGLLKLDACPNLKKLTLCTSYKLYESRFISKFLFLENLEIEHCFSLESIHISSQSIKRVRLKCFSLVEVEIVAPNLLQFDFEIIRFTSLPVVNVPKKLKVKLNLSFMNNSDVDPSTWFLQLREFLMNNFYEAKVFLRLNVHFKKNSFAIKDLEELPKLEVEHLELYLYSSSITYQALVDGVFWSCHPKYMSVGWRCVKPDPEFIKKLWENVMNTAGDISNCCNHHQIKCWRHHIEEAKVESFNGTHGAYKTLGEAMKTAEEGKRICFGLKWRAY